MTTVESILLKRAKKIEKKPLDGEYSMADNKIMANTGEGRKTAIRTHPAQMITSSKTEAYPGDDDPDPEQRQCY